MSGPLNCRFIHIFCYSSDRLPQTHCLSQQAYRIRYQRKKDKVEIDEEDDLIRCVMEVCAFLLAAVEIILNDFCTDVFDFFILHIL